MNLNFLVSRALTPVYPIIQVQLYTFAGQTNVRGTLTETYNGPFTLDANIQFPRGNLFKGSQNLQHVHGYNQTSIYKEFWINNEQITGLNRNITTGGDYLIFENLKYKIVQLDEAFRVGWIKLTCVQSEDSIE